MLINHTLLDENPVWRAAVCSPDTADGLVMLFCGEEDPAGRMWLCPGAVVPPAPPLISTRAEALGWVAGA